MVTQKKYLKLIITLIQSHITDYPNTKLVIVYNLYGWIVLIVNI
jgi:hypothetical protein